MAGQPDSASAPGERRCVIGAFSYSYADSLGRGSFADVYKGRRDADGSPVAVKQIKKSRLKSATARRVLESEVAILKDMVHENVVRLLASEETDEHICLVFEYCNGGDLFSYLADEAPLSEPAIADLVQQIANALSYMRQKNIVHRDLKPHNILLNMPAAGGRPQIKIADFGFARELMSQDMAATFCGSPLFMAPEVLEGGTYNAKADLWSVGVIIYQCLTGSAPFQAESIKALQELFRRKRVDVKLPAVSADLEGLVRALLHPDPNRRISFEDFFAHPFLARHRSLVGSGPEHSVMPIYGDTPPSPSPKHVAKDVDDRSYVLIDKHFVELDAMTDAAAGGDAAAATTNTTAAAPARPAGTLTLGRVAAAMQKLLDEYVPPIGERLRAAADAGYSAMASGGAAAAPSPSVSSTSSQLPTASTPSSSSASGSSGGSSASSSSASTGRQSRTRTQPPAPSSTAPTPATGAPAPAPTAAAVRAFKEVIAGIMEPARAIMQVAQFHLRDNMAEDEDEAAAAAAAAEADMRAVLDEEDVDEGMEDSAQPRLAASLSASGHVGFAGSRLVRLSLQRAIALEIYGVALAIFRTGMGDLRNASLTQPQLLVEAIDVVEDLRARFNQCLDRVEELRTLLRDSEQQLRMQQAVHPTPQLLSAEEYIYQHAVRLCRDAAADEAIANLETAEVLYTKARTLFRFLADQAEGPDRQTLEHWAASTQRRLETVATLSRARIQAHHGGGLGGGVSAAGSGGVAAPAPQSATFYRTGSGTSTAGAVPPTSGTDIYPYRRSSDPSLQGVPAFSTAGLAYGSAAGSGLPRFSPPEGYLPMHSHGLPAHAYPHYAAAMAHSPPQHMLLATAGHQYMSPMGLSSAAFSPAHMSPPSAAAYAPYMQHSPPQHPMAYQPPYSGVLSSPPQGYYHPHAGMAMPHYQPPVSLPATTAVPAGALAGLGGVCSRCQTRYSEGSNFCTNCGNAHGSIDSRPEESTPDAAEAGELPPELPPMGIGAAAAMRTSHTREHGGSGAATPTPVDGADSLGGGSGDGGSWGAADKTPGRPKRDLPADQ